MSEGRGFWSWLTSLMGRWFRPTTAQPRYSGGLNFPDLNLITLRAELDIDRMAAENGAANVPTQTQTQPDGEELKIRHGIHQRVLEAKGETIQLADSIRASILARQLAPDVKRCDEIVEDFQRELESTNHSLRVEITNFRDQLEELTHEVDEYRQTHGIKRTPRLSEEEDRNTAFAALIGFTLIQLGANAVVFGRGSLYGLSFGLVLALGLAFVDILWHFNLGKVAARLQAPDWLNRVVGYSASVVSLVTVLAFNLGMVHLRIVTEQGGEQALGNWAPSLIRSPFGFPDFLSWALLVVGGFCSVLALGAGWIWDEPIPIFRKNGRPIMRLRHDIQELEAEQTNLRSSLFKRYDSELDDIDKKAEHHVAHIADSVNRIKQADEGFRDYCEDASNIFKALVGVYRTQNCKARSAPAPLLFDSSVSLDFDRHPLISNEEFKTVESQAKKDRTELGGKLPRARRALRSLADDTEGFIRP